MRASASEPPATTTSAAPERIHSAAIAIAIAPLEQAVDGDRRGPVAPIAAATMPVGAATVAAARRARHAPGGRSSRRIR